MILVGINESKHILIPDNAIRFRIIANSDNKEDQDLKKEIKKEVEDELFKIVSKASNIEEARNIINNNLDKVDNIVQKYNVNYDINRRYFYEFNRH